MTSVYVELITYCNSIRDLDLLFLTPFIMQGLSELQSRKLKDMFMFFQIL